MNLSKKAQAAIELAVFGAVLIFLLGAIVRSAVGNSYTQNQNFKAMRMAMLASWNGSKNRNASRNNAAVLFVEDRLSPDFNKYGDLDRNPFVASGSGTFSYRLFYALDEDELGGPASNLPITDMYINGQHFPFTTASYVTNKTITGSTECSSDCQASTSQQRQCLQNQINRNAREWGVGGVKESMFENIIPVTLGPTAGTTMAANASTIFTDLKNAGLIANVTGTDLTQGGSGLVGNVTTLITPMTLSIAGYASYFSNLNLSPTQLIQALNQILSILHKNFNTQYKLFYSMVPNGEAAFSPFPPVLHCTISLITSFGIGGALVLGVKDQALSSTLTVLDATGNPYTNTKGDMEYDLLRLGDYAAVERQFPPLSTGESCSTSSMRCNIAWQWSATAATSASMIGLDASKQTYPNYDIDGRLKPVVIYAFNYDSTTGYPTVNYEDLQGGDIDGTWDINSCGPKPGLQNESQIRTFTKMSNTCQDGTTCSLGTTCPDGTPCPQGTYLQIKEGQLYNPETGQVVRSTNKRDTMDLIQRTIQLSNNTGRFCNGGTPLGTVANDGVTPNPVEVCISPGSGDNCFSNQQNIKSTCFDENDNMLFVRSRLEDRRGNFWMTNASGQLKVQ